MSEWDAVSTVVSDATDDWDSVSTPVAPLPDPTPIQNSVQKNLSADSGESTTPANFTQNLDKGLGMPVSKMIGDGKDANQIQVPKDIRTNVVDSYKNGTASSFSDWMQSALPVAAQKVSNAGKAFVSGAVPGTIEGVLGNIEALTRISESSNIFQKILPLKDNTGNIVKLEDVGATSNLSTLTESARTWGEDIRGDVKNSGLLESGVNAAAYSLGQTASGLVLSVVTKNPTYLIAIPATVVAGQAAHQAKQAGLGPLQSAAFGIEQGGVEALTEKIPGIKLIEDLVKGSSVFKIIARQMALEVPSEQIATVLQDFNEWANLNQDQPFSSYLEKIPENAAKTLVATVLAVGAQTGTAMAIDKFSNTDLKTLVAAKTGKPESAVTQNDIDALAANAASKAGVPSHQEFADHALVMFGKEGEKDGTDLLHEIYKETGVKPDQVYTDMQSDPAIAAEIATGQIPQSYMAAMAEQPESVTSEEPPTPSGMVRLYHSGSVGEGDSGRWVSTDRRYAQDYRPDLPLFYIDIPENDARITPDYDDQGVKQGFTFNFELTPEESTQLKDIPRISNNGTAAPVSQPPPPSSPPPTPPSPTDPVAMQNAILGKVPQATTVAPQGNETPKSIGRFFQSNWDDLIRKLFNNDVKAAALFDVFENDRAEIAGSEHYLQKIQNIAKQIFGTKTNRSTVNKLYADLKHNKLGKFINARGQEVDLRYSKAEARKFAMEIENPEILATYMSPEGNGYTQEMVDAILQTLDKQDLQYIEKQKQFYADYHERLNSVYSRMNGVDLPKVSEYSPIRREKEDISIDDDLLNPATFAPNVDPSAIQQRMKNNYPVAKVADTVAMSNYISQAEKYIAWAEKLRALNQTFNDQEVARRIKEKHGPDLLKQLQTHLETFGKDLSQSYNPAQKLINSVYSKFAVAKLAFKLALIPKQFSSFMTFAAEIPAKDTLAGWADFAMNPAKAIETLMTSPVLKNRYSSGNLSMEMKVIEKNNEEYKTILGKFLKHPSFTEAAMLPAKLGDMSAVMFGGWPVYKYYIKQGLSHEEALKKVERITQDTQQSSRPYQLSLAQKNPYARLSLMFSSAPIALVRAEIRAIQDVRAGNITTAQFTRKMMIYHIFIPLLYEFIASGGEDWEDNKADYQRAMLWGPFAGIAIAGNFIKSLSGMILGTKDSKYDLQAPGFAGTIYGTLKKLNSDITKAKTDVKYGGVDDFEDILTVLSDFKNTAIDASSFAGVPEYFIKNLPLAVEQARDEEYKAAGMLAAGYPPTASIAPDKYEKKQKITNRERQKSLKSEARSEGRIIKRD